MRIKQWKRFFLFASLFSSLCLIFVPFEEAQARRSRRRISNSDFARIFLGFNPFVIQTSNINPNFLGFNPFGIGQFGTNNFSNFGFNNFNGFNSFNGFNNFNGFNGFNNFNNLNAGAFGHTAFSGSPFGNAALGGQFDPSVTFANPNFGIGNFNNLNGFNNFNNFGNFNRFGGPSFADTGTARSAATSPSGADVCGANAIENICGGDAAAQQVETEKSIIDQMRGIVGNALKRPAALVNDTTSFRQAMSMINQGARFLTQSAANWYDNYLASFSEDLDLKDLVQTQKEALIEGLYAQGFTGDIARATETIRNAEIVFKPDLNDPDEMHHFLKSCGADNSVNNAIACPFHTSTTNRIFICGGRLLAAKARSQGDPDKLRADMSHTIAHELGHMIGSERSSPFAHSMASVAACLSRGNGEPTFSDVNAEKTADWHAAWAIAKNIEKGDTQGLSTMEYLARAAQRLCGTEATNQHPSGKDRINELLMVVRQNPVAREKLPGCPGPRMGEKVCSSGPSLQGRL